MGARGGGACSGISGASVYTPNAGAAPNVDAPPPKGDSAPNAGAAAPPADTDEARSRGAGGTHCEACVLRGGSAAPKAAAAGVGAAPKADDAATGAAPHAGVVALAARTQHTRAGFRARPAATLGANFRGAPKAGVDVAGAPKVAAGAAPKAGAGEEAAAGTAPKEPIEAAGATPKAGAGDRAAGGAPKLGAGAPAEGKERGVSQAAVTRRHAARVTRACGHSPNDVAGAGAAVVVTAALGANGFAWCCGGDAAHGL